MSEEELSAQAAAEAAAAQEAAAPAAPPPPAAAAPPAQAAAPSVSLDQLVQAVQMIAQGMDALKQDYLQTKQTIGGIVAALNDNMAEADQSAFLSELNGLGEEFALGPEEKKLLYDDYHALVKEAGDKAPSALEYFKTCVPLMTKGTSDRMAKLDGLYKALVDKETADSEKNKTLSEEEEMKKQFESLKEAI